jgi:group I intron endonuclease
MSIYSIYRLTNLKTGKVYIGKTVKPLAIRLEGHLRYANEGHTTILHRSIRKHGLDCFRAEVIFNAFDEADLSDMERLFIREHDCCLLDGKHKGYNMTRGGEGFSSEEAGNISRRLLAEGNHPWQGQRGSEMAKAREARKLAEGRHHLAGPAAFDLHSRIQKDRIEAGTHNFQGPEGAAKTAEYQHALVAAGKHCLQGERGKAMHAKMLAEGRHPGKRVYDCPNCGRSGKGNRFKGFHFEKCKSVNNDAGKAMLLPHNQVVI